MQKKFVTNLVIRVTNFLTCVTNFVICVTNFVTKKCLIGKEKNIGRKEKLSA